MLTPNQTRAASRYSELLHFRDPYLDRARMCSRYSIPGLMPPEGTTGSTKLYRPFQAVVARGVNNLASQLLLTLLPPTRKPFRLTLAPKYRAQIPDKDYGEWEVALSGMEQDVLAKMEALGLRPPVFKAMQHLIVAGNCLLYIDKKKQLARLFTLDQYVVWRQADGTVNEIIVKEEIHPSSLPAEMVTQITSEDQQAKSSTLWDQYTHIKWNGTQWDVYQEVKGYTIPGSVGTYAKNRNPWLAMRWQREDGEHYSRSHCDDYYGDIVAAESLSRSMIRYAAIAAKIVFLTNPNGQTDPSDLEKADEGAFVDGVLEDIGVLQIDKSQDFTVAQRVLDDIIGRLSYAFLLNSAVRRNGERVTAEEIRYMASELENTLGGVYSVQSVEFQLPLTTLVIGAMESAGELPKLPKDSIVPTIVTGIDALGRNHEGARLDAFLSTASQQFGPEVLRFIDMGEYLRRKAAALDIESGGLVKTAEQIAAEQQRASQQALMEKAAPNAVKAIGDNINGAATQNV